MEIRDCLHPFVVEIKVVGRIGVCVGDSQVNREGVFLYLAFKTLGTYKQPKRRHVETKRRNRMDDFSNN